MFDKDVKHYQPTPRTIQQAFGPYSESLIVMERDETRASRIADAIAMAASVATAVVLAAAIGIMLGWLG